MPIKTCTTEVDAFLFFLCCKFNSRNMKTRHFNNFHIAGFTYYDGPDVYDELKIGLLVQLKHEPDNHYDAHAVAVFYNECKLGYVPRNENNQLSKLLECGYSDIMEARIQRISPEEHPENQVQVVVKLIRKNELKI